MTEADPIDLRRARIAGFAADCVDQGRGSVRPWLRHPVLALRVLADAMRLPVADARLSSSTEGALVRTGLTRSRPTFTPADQVVSLLALPSSLSEYVEAPARRAVRRKVRVARRLGLGWRLIDDDRERRALVEIADARERIHPDPQYRHEVPDNADLLDAGLWLVAETPEGAPLLLAVVPVDGEWATLRYFRTLMDGDAATVARYLLTEVLVGQLIERGARWLADTESPFVLPNGLRHFQRMVGYELFRLRLHRSPAVVVQREPATSSYSVV